MQFAFKLKESNDPNWWKIHESCLLAVSSVKPILQELSESNSLEVDLNAFINQVVIACLHESSKANKKSTPATKFFLKILNY
jgi:hypothetical protein